MLLKSSLFFLIILFNCGWGASLGSGGDTPNNPKLKYGELFPPSSHLPSSSGVEIFHVVDGAIRTFERPYYYWLLSPLPKLKIVPKTVGSSPQVSPVSTLWMLTKIEPGLDAVERADEVALFAELGTKIDRHLNLHKPQESGMSKEQYSEAQRVWTMKCLSKFRRYKDLANRLRTEGFSGEELKILVYELVFFLNLISSETAFRVLRKHKEESGYTRVLANTLGDSLLDGGQQLGQFYEQFETVVGAFGYSPKDLKMFHGAISSDVAGVLRDTIGELISIKNYDPWQQEFVKRMWRAACTLHLTATLRLASGQGKRWEKEFAPMLYQAIDIGSTEVFDSEYDVYGDKRITGHNMLVEVQKTSDSSYHVRQFNSGGGLGNHVTWRVSTSGSEDRYLSSVDMSNLSEDQIKQSGYYYVTGPDPETAIKKLYKNKHLAQDHPPTDPLLYERPQLAGTCTASSKMVYLRSFGLEGRVLEIDFKVELIKQLLNRIDRVQESKLSRAFLHESRKTENDARLAGDTIKEKSIRERREQVFSVARIQEADQYILMFPKMYVSLIASAFNEMLASLYWITDNDKPETAKVLLRHFLHEIEPIFRSASPFVPELLERTAPLIRDLHRNLFGDLELPLGIRSEVVNEPRKGLGAIKEATLWKTKEIYDRYQPFLKEKLPTRLTSALSAASDFLKPFKYSAVSRKMKEIRKSCLPPSRDKLPACFYHIIDAIYLFPYASELAAVTSELSGKLDVGSVPPELSYLLLDAMRTVYGKDFPRDVESMRQIAFASKLSWSYRPARGSTEKDCGEYDHEDIMTENLGDLARCLYLRNGLVARTSLPERLRMMRRACIPSTLEELPMCFYHIIRTLHEYPDTPELESVTKEMLNTSLVPGNFKFKDTPSDLAYLLLDTMRSTSGGSYASSPGDMDKIAFAKYMPWDYEAGIEKVYNCEAVMDEYIPRDWRRLAVCRFRENGKVVKR